MPRFSPPSGWMNDPNGPVFWRGRWHLFYQAGHPKAWGHAASDDLREWEHLPVALEPGELGECWSGCALSDGDDLVLVFTHRTDARQVQSVARSSDGLRFKTDGRSPVLADPAEPDFRDPKVFRDGDGWAMVLACGPRLRFFRSPDLVRWEATGAISPVPPEGSGAVIWECPDLFPLGGRWVLVASWMRPGAAGVCSFVGDWDGAAFRPDGPARPLGSGPDDYATISFAENPDGRRIGIGWMARWSEALEMDRAGILHRMTTPREWMLASDGALLQRPAAEAATPLSGTFRQGTLTATLGEGRAAIVREGRWPGRWEVPAETAGIVAGEGGIELFADDGRDYLSVRDV